MDAFGAYGPLRDCGLACQKIAQSLKKMYFLSTDEQRKCLQDSLITAITDQIMPCVKNASKESNFSNVVLDYPNNTYKYKDIQ